MRWWRVNDENDNESWVFESHDQNIKPNKFDVFFFWSVQIFSVFFWVFICFIKLITFSIFWFILALCGFGLNFTNLFAYYKCRKDYKKKMKDLMGGSFGTSVFVSAIKNKLGFN